MSPRFTALFPRTAAAASRAFAPPWCWLGTSQWRLTVGAVLTLALAITLVTTVLLPQLFKALPQSLRRAALPGAARAGGWKLAADNACYAQKAPGRGSERGKLRLVGSSDPR